MQWTIGQHKETMGQWTIGQWTMGQWTVGPWDNGNGRTSQGGFLETGTAVQRSNGTMGHWTMGAQCHAHISTIRAHVGKPVRQAIHGSGNMFPEERLSWPLHNTSIRFQCMGIVSHLCGSRIAMPRVRWSPQSRGLSNKLHIVSQMHNADVKRNLQDWTAHLQCWADVRIRPTPMKSNVMCMEQFGEGHQRHLDLQFCPSSPIKTIISPMSHNETLKHVLPSGRTAWSCKLAPFSAFGLNTMKLKCSKSIQTSPNTNNDHLPTT